MTAIALVPGSKYWAGASRPFYVSQSMVTSYLTGKGFGNVRWHKRSEALPSDVIPTNDTSYDDDWDEWVSADYSGAAGSLSPPTTVPWLIVHLPSAAPSTTPAPTVSKPSWVTSSAQASQAAQSAAQQAQAAGAAGASGVSSPAAAPAPPPWAVALSAPRVDHTVGAGAAVFVVGFVILLGSVAAAILPRKRRKPHNPR